jgi:hypothetical protein
MALAILAAGWAKHSSLFHCNIGIYEKRLYKMVS